MDPIHAFTCNAEPALQNILGPRHIAPIEDLGDCARRKGIPVADEGNAKGLLQPGCLQRNCNCEQGKATLWPKAKSRRQACQLSADW